MTRFGVTISILVIVLLTGAGILISKSSIAIGSFEECAKAGYAIMESYPAQCRTFDGKIFIQELENPIDIPTPNQTSCFIGGCSAQICSDQKDVASDCQYKEEYACYKTTRCERQTNGQCGWTPTPQLSACLQNASITITGNYVAGHVNIGPFCGVEREGQPCKVPLEAYTSREVVVYGTDKTTVKKRVSLDIQGNYKIPLVPGNYFVQVVPAGIGPGEQKYVVVKPFDTAIVNFDIDTGIR